MAAKSAGPKRGGADERRKLIAFDQESWQALDLLARDSMSTVQELADEAFRDLLKKHGRPVDLKDALRRSARAAPVNDNKTARGRPKPTRRKP
jgi:hypothetical protein